MFGGASGPPSLMTPLMGAAMNHAINTTESTCNVRLLIMADLEDSLTPQTTPASIDTAWLFNAGTLFVTKKVRGWLIELSSSLRSRGSSSASSAAQLLLAALGRRRRRREVVSTFALVSSASKHELTTDLFGLPVQPDRSGRCSTNTGRRSTTSKRAAAVTPRLAT